MQIGRVASYVRVVFAKTVCVTCTPVCCRVVLRCASLLVRRAPRAGAVYGVGCGAARLHVVFAPCVGYAARCAVRVVSCQPRAIRAVRVVCGALGASHVVLCVCCALRVERCLLGVMSCELCVGLCALRAVGRVPCVASVRRSHVACGELGVALFVMRRASRVARC